MNVGDLSTSLVYAAIAAYTVAMIAFAVDVSALLAARTRPANRRGASIGMSTTWLAASLHLLALVTRGVAAGRAPWANMFEFTLMFTFFMVAIFLGISLRRDIRFVGVGVTLIAVLGLGLAVNVLFVAAEGVEPILDSYWLLIHVSVATLSVGIFSVAALFAVLQLLQHRVERSRDGALPEPVTAVRSKRARAASQARAERAARMSDGAGGAGGAATTVALADPPAALTSEAIDADAGEAAGTDTSSLGRLMSNLPSAATFESWCYRLSAIGFITWTFTLIAGAIWAEHAWGRPWGWDPKETWTFVIWVIYAAYLHARATVGWTAEKFAYFALVGFLALLANFYVVNIFIPGNHSYAF